MNGRYSVASRLSLVVVVSMLASILLSAIAVPSVIATDVSGQVTSDTTWTKANSPYVTTGNILVLEGVTLTIEPGVSIKVGAGMVVQIHGKLVARGTSAEPIVFTSNQASPAKGDWIGIQFSPTSDNTTYDAAGSYADGSIMQYCTVEYAGKGAPAVKIESGSALVDHCSIVNNGNMGICMSGGSLKVLASTVGGNTSDGIHADNCNATITGNAITGNSISASASAIDKSVFASSIYATGTVKITENSFGNNTASLSASGEFIGASEYACGGIYATGTVEITGNSFDNNTASVSQSVKYREVKGYACGGIYATGTVKISGNSFDNNTASVSASNPCCEGAHGYACGGIYATGTVEISGNSFNNNTASTVATGGDLTPVDVYANACGAIWAEGTVDIRENSVVSNLASASSSAVGNAHSYSAGGMYASGKGIFAKNSITGNSGSASASATTWVYSPFAEAYGAGGVCARGVGGVIRVTGNTITGNTGTDCGGGVYTTGAFVTQNTISGNSARQGGGIYGGDIIGGNTISNNTAAEGGGVYVKGSGTVTVCGNTITNNSASVDGGGIYSTGQASISANEVTSNSISQPGGRGGGIFIASQPAIHHNNLHGNTAYDVYDSNPTGTANADATNNWWGTTDEAAIQAHIYDWADNNALQLVTFKPYLTSPVTDFTPPTTPTVIDDGATTANTTQLHARWSSSDTESGISEYQYAIGTYPGGTDLVGLTSAGTNTEVAKTGLKLTWEATYYFAIMAKNGLQNWSELGVSDGILVHDSTPPTTPVVTVSGTLTNSGSSLSATWISTDNESGIAEYQYAIGTSAGATDVVGWTSVGTSTAVTKGGLTLTVGTKYYFAVKAENGSGVWSTAGTGGIIWDTTPPAVPTVSDDGASTTSKTQLHARWSSSDSESGITEYQYAIGTYLGGTDLVGWTSAGTNTEVTKTGLTLTSGTTYYFAVKARNGTGQWSQVSNSDGILVTQGSSPNQTGPSHTPGQGGAGGLPVWAWIAIGVGAAGALGAGTFFLRRQRRGARVAETGTGRPVGPVVGTASQPGSLFCPNCGTENVEGNRFCLECGASLIARPDDDSKVR